MPTYAPGATPIDLDEAKGLVPAHLTLQRELNEYEESNILEATAWLFARRRGNVESVFEEPMDRQMLIRRLGVVTRARGMMKLAKETGITRASTARALCHK